MGTHTSSHLFHLFSPPVHLTALLSVCTPIHTQLNHHSKALSRSFHLSLPPLALRPISGPQHAGLHSTSHVYQLCQLANGRAGWTAGDRNKKRPFCPTRFIHLERSVCEQHIKKGHNKTEYMMPNCPATKPHGPGTPPLIWTSCSSTTAPVAASSISPCTSGQPTA